VDQPALRPGADRFRLLRAERRQSARSSLIASPGFTFFR
jgi:hypothetical protein